MSEVKGDIIMKEIKVSFKEDWSRAVYQALAWEDSVLTNELVKYQSSRGLSDRQMKKFGRVGQTEMGDKEKGIAKLISFWFKKTAIFKIEFITDIEEEKVLAKVGHFVNF